MLGLIQAFEMICELAAVNRLLVLLCGPSFVEKELHSSAEKNFRVRRKLGQVLPEGHDKQSTKVGNMRPKGQRIHVTQPFFMRTFKHFRTAHKERPSAGQMRKTSRVVITYTRVSDGNGFYFGRKNFRKHFSVSCVKTW